MIQHRNPKLGLAGRVALVQAIAGGMSLWAAAAASTVWKVLRRHGLSRPQRTPKPVRVALP